MKRHFKIYLFEGANKLAEMVALEAAKYNARSENMNLQLLWAFAMTIKELTEGWEETSIELLTDNTVMHIDTKIDGHYETVCIIESVVVVGIVNGKMEEAEIN